MTLRGLRVTLGKGRMGKVGWELLLELAGSAPHHQPANRALHPVKEKPSPRNLSGPWTGLGRGL